MHKSVLLHISPAQWALKKIKEKAEKGKTELGGPCTAAGVARRPVRERGHQHLISRIPSSFTLVPAAWRPVARKAAARRPARHWFWPSQRESSLLGKEGAGLGDGRGFELSSPLRQVTLPSHSSVLASLKGKQSAGS